MDPVAFYAFGIGIRWYGILIASGILLGTLVAIKRAKRVGINEENILDMLLFAVPAAIVGARVYYVIFNWEYYAGDFYKIINVRQGGLAIHGGVIGGALVAYIFCKSKNISFPKMADICAPSLILGQAIGRWGNFVNQEAYGGPTDLPWGIVVDGVKVHPTFLYESLWNFMVFGVLLWYDKRKKFDGELFLFYLMLYSVARFFIEGLRTDSLMFAGMRVAQLISVGAILISLFLVYLGRKKKHNDKI
ncbi:prolipoprotein diacylglyceryl transferase [Anaeromicrobium sediminis]|uniref:Phosphatidylglycerol--prolipoprotein diacylglyceryl transferase n=1 Tax=Anaeromicrobium sediminis TaxID=1478221 RepID=A0A267MGX3_9FIRM|nr:prolipoprotein diacylglyceryl transferase [Anaeromicrobium sediminis]PAB58819.1 prolipoprotein diacylglyceryl transferase [Anaeromicrobium sediminis]